MSDVILWVLVLWWIPPVIFLCTQSTHRREKKEIKEHGHVRNTWNPKEY